MTTSSITSAFPCSRSATTIMCLAKRPGAENVSGNDWSRKSRNSNDARIDLRFVELSRDQASAVAPLD